MVTHIDMAESKLGFSKFTLQELALSLKISYGLARKYALEWVEKGKLNKFKRQKSNSPDQFQFVRRKMKDWNTDSMEELQAIYDDATSYFLEDCEPVHSNEPLQPKKRKTRGQAIRPELAPGPTEEEVDELVKSYLEDDEEIYPPLGASVPTEDDYTVAPTVDMLLEQIMKVSSNWKTRALTAEKDNDRIKQALADFLVGLKSEDF